MGSSALWLRFVNAALYVVTCALVGTGLMLELRMDEEDGPVRLFGLGRDDWGEHHIVIAIVFVALTMLHLLVNWAWIKSAVLRARWATPMLALGLALIGVLLLWPTDGTAIGGGTEAGQHQGDRD